MTPDLKNAPPPRPVDPGLYVVATPIGNLRDISLRALDVLAAAEVVLAEDTRVASRLLSAYGLKKTIWRFDDHVEGDRIAEILQRLSSGGIIAQVSDAGTPLVSDPGYRLMKAVRDAGLRAFSIPGASSVLAALCVSGLPVDQFHFAGFLPPKSSARQTRLKTLKAIDATLIVFESGPRLLKSLTDILSVLGDRRISLCRELTKLHETVIMGRVSALISDPRCDGPRGEMVLVIAPQEGLEGAVSHPDRSESLTLDEALKAALVDLSPSEAAKQIAARFHQPRQQVYQRALQLKSAS